MKTLLIVGDSMKQFREHIISLGYEYVQLRDAMKCKNPSKKLRRRVVCDFTSRETIDEAINELHKRYKVDGVICTYENYIVHSAYISKKLGLLGMPMQAALACTDKYLMRELFSPAPRKISPAFKEVLSFKDAERFMEHAKFPVILKPANLAKSLLVSKCDNYEELKTNYDSTTGRIGNVYQKYAPNLTPKLLIEEYMEGSVHSVDAFIDQNGVPHVLDNVVDYQTGYDIGFDDNFHYSRLLPSNLTKEQIAEVRQVAQIGCRALGMKNSPAHVEIIMTNEGPKIVEIGARNGGYRERMHSLANGIDIINNAIAIALGEPLKLEPSKNDYCAVLEIFPRKEGTFLGISNEEGLRNLQSLKYFAVKQPLGHYVGKSSKGYKMCAIAILSNSSKELFNTEIDYITNNCQVVTS